MSRRYQLNPILSTIAHDYELSIVRKIGWSTEPSADLSPESMRVGDTEVDGVCGALADVVIGAGVAVCRYAFA